MAAAKVKDALALFEAAWGDQEGYVCLSERDPHLENTDDGYWRDQFIKWPEGREQVEHLVTAARRIEKDLYWAPLVFTEKHRKPGSLPPSLPVLWSDLDEVDPDTIPDDLRPTALWETSPNRYQALWQLDQPLDSETHRTINRNLTYALGGDRGGWGLTKVLRIPGLPNHKYDAHPRVSLLSLNGHRLGTKEVIALAQQQTNLARREPQRGDVPDPSTISRKRISGKARALLRATPSRGEDRSERLWELECLLAESGLNRGEIVALVRGSGWNKFRGRAGELGQLFTEADKAIARLGGAAKSPVVTAFSENGRRSDEEEPHGLDDDDDTLQSAVPWGEFDSDHRPIEWLVADVWGEGEVGFISGLPKSFKSWISLDLAVSVATGTPFLGSFAARPHNTLLIQEEDPKRVLQDRLVQVAASKGFIYAERIRGGLEFQYDLPDSLHIASNVGFQITSDEWLEWLTGEITRTHSELVVLDPLMMMAEGVDEFKAFEMMANVLKPLKQIRQATDSAMVLIHHHTKQEAATGGGKMYGSVAFWAWEESALHLNVTGPSRVVAERFSKHARLSPMTIDIPDPDDEGWAPVVTLGVTNSSLVDILSQYDSGVTAAELADITKMGRAAVMRELGKLEKSERIEKEKAMSSGPGRKQYMYRLVKGVGVGEDTEI